MRKRTLLLGAGLLTSVVLGLGIACGDDNKDSNGGTTPSATEADATEPDATEADATEADATEADATETPEDGTPTG